MTLRALVFALLATFTLPAEAGKICWFNLHEEVVELVFVCLSEENARNFALLKAVGDEEASLFMRSAGYSSLDCD